jgi:hypothetical protein
MNRWLPFALLVVTLPATAGCGRGALALGTGMLVGAAIVASQEPPREEVVVYQNAPPVYVVTQPRPAPAPPPPAPAPAPPAAFDAAAARAALDDTDLGSCKAEGAPLGYGHARVTFAPDGGVSHVAIESPSGLSGSAVRCIGAALGTATVPPFGGPASAVPTPFWVR